MKRKPNLSSMPDSGSRILRPCGNGYRSQEELVSQARPISSIPGPTSISSSRAASLTMQQSLPSRPRHDPISTTPLNSGDDTAGMAHSGGRRLLSLETPAAGAPAGPTITLGSWRPMRGK